MIRTSVIKKLRHSSLILLRMFVLICRKAELAFFMSGFYFTNIMIYRTAGEEGGYLFIYFLPTPSVSLILRHKPGYCCREPTSADSRQPDSNQEPLVS